MEGGVYVSFILFEENGHLTNASLKGLKEGIYQDNELILLSEHIGKCEKCADALANVFNNNELAYAPFGFEEEILSKISKKKESSKQFLFYSLRVAMVASIAIIFVFSNPLNFVSNTQIKTLNLNPISLSTINTINLNINDFSQKIINMEVFNNEKGKK